MRPADPADLEALAALWEAGWHDGHDGHVPEVFQEIRTSSSFRERMAERLSSTTVVERDGEVAGFVTVVDDELEQVFVASAHRGTGIAGDLLSHGLDVVRATGHDRAWLSVVVGNARARRFYEREGWTDHGALDYLAEGPDGPVVSPCRRYERDTHR